MRLPKPGKSLGTTSGIQADGGKKGMALRSWKDICKPVSEGGLGIRDLMAVNKSILVQSAWRILTNPNDLLSSVLKSKYFPNTSFWKARTDMPKSAFWSSILQVRDVLEEASVWQLSKGDISIWSQPWCSIWKNIHDQLNLDNLPFHMPDKVSDLWDENKNWDAQKITQIFDSAAQHSIMQVQIMQGEEEDRLCWKYTPSGVCSAKSAYKTIYNEMYPNQNQIWKARNDINFKTKIWEPQQVCNAAQAMAKTYESVHQMEEDSCQDFNRAEENNIRNSIVKIPTGTRVYVDASWKEEKIGVGIFIHNPSNHNAIVIKAQSLNAGTPLLAEAEGLFLAMQIARHLQLQDPIFLSDNSEIVNVVQNEDYIQNPGHWSLRPILSRIKNFLQDQQVRIIWISRELNKVADGLAKSARQAQTNSCLAFDCSNISHICSRDVCPTKRALSFTPNGAVNVTRALCF
ncbi:hypothetical protein OsJ_31193 [Oryza sativa Japonica Group]|uniref:RNase H type-1 domain-containing protein n=1 Tax=Oryza sativa subsp. japonica TaxID=39947 RepID=B9G5B0_ORYSJ|nr:hypothetical protein OsJ_31193 [Oryza sativa Japonica Group]